MAKQRIGVGGAIVVIVVAGLILYGAITYGPEIWERIKGIGEETTPIRSIVQAPETYENQQVTVIGEIALSLIVDDEGFSMHLSNLPSNFMPREGKYKVTGRVVQEYWMYINNIGYGTPYWCIKVSNISKL